MGSNTVASYDIGTLAQLAGAFTDPLTTASIDPDVVKLSIQDPSGAIVTYVYNSGDDVIVRDAQGLYHADVSLTKEGTWTYRWWSTGNGQASDENQIMVVSLGADNSAYGSGSRTVTVTFDDGATPPEGIPNLKVRVSSEASGVPTVAGPAFTDANGVITLYLNPGTYYVFRAHPEYDFSSIDPYTLVVT